MKKKFLSLLIIPLLAGCTGTGSTDVPEDTKTNKTFDELVALINTDHNYSVKVHSYIDDDPTDIYDDTFVMINDKAFYNKYYSGYSGIIYQKDQGYVNYIEYGDGTIQTYDFVATTSNGIHTFYDLAIENLFTGGFTFDSEENVYTNSNKKAIAVGCNLSGFIDITNFVAPEKLIASFDIDKQEISVEVPFTIWYLDPITLDPVNPQGHCTLTICEIGTSTNKHVEDYISNPTYTYQNPTKWSNSDKEYFKKNFNSKEVSLVPDMSYTYQVFETQINGKYTTLLHDYLCGDKISEYGEILVNSDHFTKISDQRYQLIETDSLSGNSVVYTVDLFYIAPTKIYTEDKTYGDLFPNGVFEVRYSTKISSAIIDSVSSLNKYISSIGLDEYIPLLTFGNNVTSVTNFEDVTLSMNNQNEEDLYIFYTSSKMISFYVADFETAKRYVEEYVALLFDYGFTNKHSAFGMANYLKPSDGNESYITISDLTNMDESNYLGYFQMRFNIYSDCEKKPTISDTSFRLSIATLVGGQITLISPSSTGKVEQGTRVTFSVTPNEGYELDTLFIVEDRTITINKNDDVYSFTMPSRNITISATFTKVGGDISTDAKLEEIIVSGQKLEFFKDDTFVFDGICTAYYDDGTSRSVTPNVTSPDMSTVGRKTVNVSYTENGITKTTYYSINVSEKPSSESSISGTYKYENPGKTMSLIIVLKADGTGTYDYKSTLETINFTYEVDENYNVTFKYVSGPNDSYGLYKLFNASLDDNTSGILKDGLLTVTFIGQFGNNKMNLTKI